MGSGVPVQGVRVPLQPFSLMLFPVCHLSIIIDGHTSSDWSPGPMLVWDRLGLFLCDVIICVCYTMCMCDVRCMRHVGIISDVFLAFFVIC